jgi:hypothetical protein
MHSEIMTLKAKITTAAGGRIDRLGNLSVANKIVECSAWLAVTELFNRVLMNYLAHHYHLGSSREMCLESIRTTIHLIRLHFEVSASI